MIDISVVFASRGRFAGLVDTVDSLRDHAIDNTSIEVIVAMDPDDSAMYAVKNSRYSDGITASLWVAPERYGYTQLHVYLNELVKQASGRWLMWFNDDMQMLTPGWDDVIRNHNRQAVLWPHANHVHHANIAPIWPKAWADKLGYASPTTHMDTYLQRLGEAVGRHDPVPIQITHNRPDVTGAASDQTFAEGREKLGAEGMVPGWYESAFHHTVAVDAAAIRGLL